MIFTRALVVALLSSVGSVLATNSHDTHQVHTRDAPHRLEERGDPNNCRAKWGDSSPTAKCRTAYINSIMDFCLFAPSHPGTIGDEEANVVSYCTKSGYGTRLIPPGTIHGAQWLKTKEYIQVVGLGDFTKINIKRGDPGGELDPHGANLLGNPVNSHIFTRAFTGQFEEIQEWHMFMGADEFSFRACINSSPERTKYCNNRYDEQGSQWVDPGRYENGVFEACDADPGEAPGWYGKWHWEQGQGKAPAAHPPPKTYNCRHYNGITGGRAVKIP